MQRTPAKIPPTSPVAVARVAGTLWPQRFAAQHKDQLYAGFSQWCIAQLGHPVTTPHHHKLLPRDHDMVTLWSCLFRPLDERGTTGLDLALRWERLSAPVQQAALWRLKEARGVLLEVLQLQPGPPGLARVSARDLLSERLYPQLLIPGVILKNGYIGQRLYGLIVNLGDLGDGHYMPVGGLRTSVVLKDLDPLEFLQRACALLRKVDLDTAGLDPADHDFDRANVGAALRRTCGIAFVAAQHWVEEQPEDEFTQGRGVEAVWDPGVAPGAPPVETGATPA